MGPPRDVPRTATESADAGGNRGPVINNAPPPTDAVRILQAADRQATCTHDNSGRERAASESELSDFQGVHGCRQPTIPGGSACLRQARAVARWYGQALPPIGNPEGTTATCAIPFNVVGRRNHAARRDRCNERLTWGVWENGFPELRRRKLDRAARMLHVRGCKHAALAHIAQFVKAARIWP